MGSFWNVINTAKLVANRSRRNYAKIMDESAYLSEICSVKVCAYLMGVQFYQISVNTQVSNVSETGGEIRTQVMRKFSRNAFMIIFHILIG